MRCGSLKRLSVPATTTMIQSQAFRGCISLVDVELGEGLARIGNRAFQDCISICTLSLPGSMEQVESDAFSGCKSLLGVEVPTTNDELEFESCVFKDCHALANVSVPDSVDSTSIFRNCYFSGNCVEFSHRIRHSFLQMIQSRFCDLTN